MLLRPGYPVRTDRLTLRPFVASDLDDLFAIQSLPEVARFLYWEPRSRKQVREVLATKVGQTVLDDRHDVLAFAIVWHEVGRVVGEVDLMCRSREHDQGEIGFVFNPAYHGRGLATEAAEAALRLGFAGAGMHRIVGRCDARNLASARTLERLGMRREAHFVHNEFFKGEWSDELVYALLAHEWESRQTSEGGPP